MSNMQRRSFLAFPLLAAATRAFGAEWPQWRGPTRDGEVTGTPWPVRLDGMEELWRVPLQPSYSGPIVAGGKVFVTETRNKKSEATTAYSLDGTQQWSFEWNGAMNVPFFARANGSWIRSTPALSGNRLLVGGMRDVMVCLDTESGAELWRNDFVATEGSPLPSFGFVCSPLIDDDSAYVQAGGGFLKLDMATGKVIWRSLRDGGGMYGSAFSSPVLATIDGVRQLVVQSRKDLAGVSPDTGSKLWSTPVPAFRGMNILPPTVHGNSVFTSSYGGGSFCFEVSRNADTDEWVVSTKWKNTVQGYMSSPMVFGDHVYLHLKNRRFTCMELETGQQKWSSKPFGKYWSCVKQENRMLALDERGELLLVEPDENEFRLVDRRKVATNSWAHLAVVDDLALVRDLNELIVYRWK